MNRRDLMRGAVAGLLGAVWPRAQADTFGGVPRPWYVRLRKYELARGIETAALELAPTATRLSPCTLALGHTQFGIANAAPLAVSLRSSHWEWDLSLASGAAASVTVHDGAARQLICLSDGRELVGHEWFPKDWVPWGGDRWMHLTVRRWRDAEGGGHVTLGERLLGAGEPLRVRAGEHIGLHVFNSSLTHPASLCLPGHQFCVWAFDGRAVPHAWHTDHLVLAPGESVDASIRMDRPGRYVLGSLDRRDQDAGFGMLLEYAGATGRALAPEPMLPRWHYALLNDPAIPFDALDERAQEILLLPADAAWHSQRLPARSAARLRLAIVNGGTAPFGFSVRGLSFDLMQVGGQIVTALRRDTLVVPAYQRAEIELEPQGDGVDMLTLAPPLALLTG